MTTNCIVELDVFIEYPWNALVCSEPVILEWLSEWEFLTKLNITAMDKKTGNILRNEFEFDIQIHDFSLATKNNVWRRSESIFSYLHQKPKFNWSSRISHHIVIVEEIHDHIHYQNIIYLEYSATFRLNFNNKNTNIRIHNLV